MQPKVYVILVNYNGFKDTVECIESLEKIDYDNYKIVVVDNASTVAPTNEQEQFIKQHTIYIENKNNGGFSAGNNIGIKLAKKNHADYVLLLNNDTTVTSNFLKDMVSILESKGKTGVLSAKIMYYWDKDKAWFEGGTFDFATAKTSHFHAKKNDDEVEEVTFISGCLMLIPMSVLDTVGMLEESYFLYAEDTDYCCRVLKKGFKLYYAPSIVIYHKEGATAGKNSAMKQYYIERNGLYIAKQYSTHPIKACIARAYTSWKSVFRGRLNFKPIMNAYVDFFRGKKGEWSNKEKVK